MKKKIPNRYQAVKEHNSKLEKIEAELVERATKEGRLDLVQKIRAATAQKKIEYTSRKTSKLLKMRS